MMPMRRATLVRWAAHALYYSGLMRPLSVVAGYLGGRPRFPILSYHRVNDDGDPFFPAVPISPVAR